MDSSGSGETRTGKFGDLGGRCSPERDPSLAKDSLERGNRVRVDLQLAKARHPELAFLAERSQHERPVILRGRILVRLW